MTAGSNQRFIAILTVLALFVAGLVAGIALDRILFDGRRGPPPRRHRPPVEALLQRFADKLDLSPEQKQQVHDIMEEGRAASEQVIKETHPELRAIRKSLEEKIAALLDEDQAKTYRAMLDHGRGLPGGPPGKLPPPRGKPPRGEHPPGRGPPPPPQ